MVSFFRSHFMMFHRKNLAIHLAFVWCFGLVFGCLLAMSSDLLPVSLMRTALECPVSIVGLLTVLLLPLLLSAFAVYISQIWLLIPIAFLKALSYSYIAACFSLFQPAGNWLLRFLLLFSDSFSIPALCWIWFKCCSGSKREILKSFVFVFFLFILIGLLDYCCISPFLSNLLS